MQVAHRVRKRPGRSVLGHRCFVLPGEAGRDAAAFADLDAVFHGPGPDGSVVLAAAGIRRVGTAGAAGPSGVLDEQHQLDPEPARVVGVQVDLVLLRVQAESDSLLRRAAVEIFYRSIVS